MGDVASAVCVRPATREDVPLLLELFGELARYEKLEQLLVADEQLLTRALFGERPAAEALIAELDGEVAGYAVFYSTFSTFLAVQGIWLEDLYVRPDRRKSGAGRALLAAVAATLLERGGQRLEWSALDWNELALGFYRSLGAEQMNDWITHRLTGDDLRALAREGAVR
ncbi:MAG TPA: GNAT family N-acetyltransferase [Solirubrobacteraceae bacterium]|nr:GNAT family N-acetyltransferase [Solirubrobacteraceae bacterium]